MSLSVASDQDPEPDLDPVPNVRNGSEQIGPNPTGSGSGYGSTTLMSTHQTFTGKLIIVEYSTVVNPLTF
jgi:hypothetical protein